MVNHLSATSISYLWIASPAQKMFQELCNGLSHNGKAPQSRNDCPLHYKDERPAAHCVLYDPRTGEVNKVWCRVWQQYWETRCAASTVQPELIAYPVRLCDCHCGPIIGLFPCSSSGLHSPSCGLSYSAPCGDFLFKSMCACASRHPWLQFNGASTGGRRVYQHMLL